MSARDVGSTDELVADYVRSSMSVEPPATLNAEVMRSVALVDQERRTWLSSFGLTTPALAAIAATALIVVVGTFLITSPRNVGPPTDPGASPTATPVPTITPEDARILTEPGDVIRIPALDAEGQFGTITIRRGEDRAGYENFVPFAFGDVFFIELYVKYEPDRVTDEQYGEWEFAYAVDLGGHGFDDEEVQRGVGFLGMEEQLGYESAPQPILQGKRFGDEVLEGWLVLEVPAVAADYALHLVYGHGEWTDGIQNMIPDASALLREPGEPMGVSVFDPNYVPPQDPDSTPMPMPSWHVLPTPMPTVAPTFEPTVDADADSLFTETQTCRSVDLGLTLTFPAAWYTNEEVEDQFGGVPACTVFSPDPMDDLFFSGLSDQQFLAIQQSPDWVGGIEEPTTERLPLGDRIAWRITYTEDQQSYGTTYLVPLSDDPYGPFLFGAAMDDEMRAVLERMLLLLEFNE